MYFNVVIHRRPVEIFSDSGNWDIKKDFLQLAEKFNK